ncbi:MAG TPA: thiol:disulfide interchange protein DsbA/DsbL [Steroidobacteraceae bacterium]|nr:thiol:disulfide interchange protein DsbA/DsbL [Steroidobacteraceae bacterium]
MLRTIPLAALLALCACSRHSEPAPATPPPAPAASTQPATAPETAPAPVPAPAAAAQSETQQATASQESGDTETERPARSDASLERMAALPASAQLPDGRWQPGVNYDPLVPAQPTSVAPGKVEVVEVLWLACPHCYALEPHIRNWLKTKPPYIEFVRVPAMWQPIHRAHARLFYTLESLGREDLIARAFDTIHDLAERRQPMLVGNSDDETFRIQQQFATQNGVSADDFAKTYNSFTVSSDLQRAEQLTQRYHVEGVPFFVVNGKYTTDIGKAGGEKQLIELIGDLAAAEHRH